MASDALYNMDKKQEKLQEKQKNHVKHDPNIDTSTKKYGNNFQQLMKCEKSKIH